MEHDIKKDRRLLEPEEGLEEDKVSGTADGKEFRQPLNNPKKDGLNESDLSPP